MVIKIFSDQRLLEESTLSSNGRFTFLRYRIPFVFLGFVSAACFSVFSLSFSVFVSYIVFGVLGLSFSISQGNIGVKLFSVIYSIAIVFAILLYFVFDIQYGVPYGGGGSDSFGYELHALELVKNNILYYSAEEIGSVINLPYHNSKGYIYLVSLLIRFGDFFGGFHTMVTRFFNAGLLGTCSVVVYSICQKISLTSKQSLISALVTGLFPIMIYVGVQSLRDIPIVLILLFSVSLSIDIIQSRFLLTRICSTLLFIPFILIAMEFRLLNVINIVLVLTIAWVVRIFSIKKISFKHIAVVAVVFLGVYNSILFSNLPILINLVSKLDSSSADLTGGVDRANEGGLSLILFNLPVPFNYIGSLFYSFITPLPIVYTKDADWNFLSLGTIYQFLFIPFVFVGLKSKYRVSLMLPLFLMFSICFVGYVFGSFTFRHITYIVPFAAIYGAIGYALYYKYRYVIWTISGSLLVFLLFVYYTIKIL